MKTAITILIIFLSLTSQAQTISLYDQLKAGDSLLFEIGYNTCDISQFENLVSGNFEFYHDEAGTTTTKAAFISGIRDGLCKLPYKPRRQLVAGSLKVYPLYKNGTLYGAVQSGEHKFFAIEKDKPEYLTSTAKFTSIWLLENGRWHLSRVISYDHQKP